MKKLILVRHAHRDTGDGRSKDNGLSERGHRQVEEITDSLLKFLRKNEGTVALFTSPRKRCQETLELLASQLNAELKVLQLLDEQGLSGEEGPEGFTNRLKTFAKWWMERGPQVTIACSHGDWIPEFVATTASKNVDLPKGAWVELELSDSGKIKYQSMFTPER